MSKSEGVIDPAARRRSRLVMLGLIAIFVGPIVIAWFYTAGHVELGSATRTNRGILLNPAIDLRESVAAAPLFERAKLAPGEWLMLYLTPGTCDAPCLAALDRLRTIRSLLGYSGQRVRVLSLAESVTVATDPGAIAHQHQMVDKLAHEEIVSSLAAAAVDSPQIVFIDWRKQLALRFAGDAPSIDVKKDLKRLLRASKIR